MCNEIVNEFYECPCPGTGACTLQLGLGRVCRFVAGSEGGAGALAQGLDDFINSIQDPLVALVGREPRAALDILLSSAVLKRLTQPKAVADDLWADACLRPQACNGGERGQYPTDIHGRLRRRWIREQRAIVCVEDVHGQIGVRGRQLVVQLVLERVVD